MPISYKSGSELIKTSIDNLSEKLDRQNDLLEKLIKAVAKDKK